MANFDEPIADYVSYFRDHHARNVSEFFEDLVRLAGIDEQENLDTVAEINKLELKIAGFSKTRRYWRMARIAAIVLAVVLAVVSASLYLLPLLPAAGLIAWLIIKVNPRVKDLNGQIQNVESSREVKLQEAWAQLEPLNLLHDWNVATTLFQKTFPDFKFDRFFTEERLLDLHENFNLPYDFNNSRSILGSQSGRLKGNPFVFANYVHHWIGSFTYQGFLTIYWTERVRNSQGEVVTVQKTETLRASVAKPYPQFAENTSLIYGHEAAPNLSFSRWPSNLSGLEEGTLNNWRKGSAMKRIEKKAAKQVSKGTGNLTVMANREFETLFKAINRDDEIEFRLLFTPLAQQEMVNLLNDKNVAYGDDFSFTKFLRSNIVDPQHLNNIPLDDSPELFHTYDIEKARSFFNNFHNEFFRGIYFSFAPLLTVPLYREKRSIPEYRHKEQHQISYWEHEAMANFLGENLFAHPLSITRNLLKTESRAATGTAHKVTVTAYGYRGTPMVDYVPVRGGDGNIHQVPVPWTEYTQVEQQSQMLVGANGTDDQELNEKEISRIQANWESALSKHSADQSSVVNRGFLSAVFLR